MKRAVKRSVGQALAVLLAVFVFGSGGSGAAFAAAGAGRASEDVVVAGIPAALAGVGGHHVADVSESVAGTDDAGAEATGVAANAGTAETGDASARGEAVNEVDAPETDTAPSDAEAVEYPDPFQIVRRSFAARWEKPVHFREVRTLMRGDRSETTVRSVWWRPWTDLRIEEEYEHGRRMMVWNEDGHWLYDTRFPFALYVDARDLARLRGREGDETFPYPPGPPGLGFAGSEPPAAAGDAAPQGHDPRGRGFVPPFGTPKFTAPGDWESRPETGAGGRPVFVVERRWREGTSRWWIDREHHFPWKEEHFGPGDELSAVIVRSDAKFDADIEDELFEFEAPEGVDVLRDPREWRRQVSLHSVRERLPFPVAMPRVIPEGFELIGGHVAWLQGRPAVHWRFSDGRRLLSVFQLRVEEFEGRRHGWHAPAPTETVVEEGRAVGVVRDGYLFFVVGDATTEEALEILENLEIVDE